MIYPKEVQDFVIEQMPWGGRFKDAVFPGDLNKTSRSVPQHNYWFEYWLCTAGYRQSQAIRDYIDFIAEMKTRFREIRANMLYRNPTATHQAGDDVWAAGLAGDVMLTMAMYLYYLHSYGLRGAVLECGIFKGGSTCCLSWACHYLGLKLIAADSFEGLPESSGYYNTGDFKGSYDEVYGNVSKYGKIETVQFIQGFFADSLKGFHEDLMLICLDVDLYTSVMDALDYAFPRLLPGGVIFSDGLGAQTDFEGERLKANGGEAAGIVDYLEKHKISHKAKHVGYKSYIGLVVPHCAEGERLLYVPKKQRFLVGIADRDWRAKILRAPRFVLKNFTTGRR
jgi:hypothetical protein